MKYLLISLFVSLWFNAAIGQQDVLIKNGTLLTITDGVKEETDILLSNGKIKSIGKDLAAANARVIDAEGLFVMPGIVDAHSHIAIDAVNEATNPVTAEVFVGDAIDPYDIAMYRALAGGVTISHAMHGSANAIGGQCETLKHRWGELNPKSFVMEGAPRTIKFALGENPMRVHGEGKDIAPRTRMGIEQEFRRSFEGAKRYKQAWADHQSGKTKKPPAYSLRMQTLADILDGKIIIHCHSYRADEILMLMNVLSDFGVDKICFQHVNEGFKIAPELAEFGAHASVFSDWWAYKFEVYYSTAYNAAILTKNGVITSINSDDAGLIRHLYHEAAKTQRYGSLSDNEALRLITLNPAIQLGIDDRVGSLEVNKEADVAIFKNHPLSVYATPQMTIVDGVVRFDINEDMDDMRMEINPEAMLPAFYEQSEGHEDKCMQGVNSEHHHHAHSHHQH